MKTAIVYTALALVNLIGFMIGIALLPASVPVHFDWKGVVDSVGSPWVFVSLPAAAALVSAGLWATAVSHGEKNKGLIRIFLCVIGALLAMLGWVFFALSSQAEGLGDRVNFPYALVTVLPVSLLLVFFGNYMPRLKQNAFFGIRTPSTRKSEEVWTRTHRVGGYAFFVAGLISAVCSVVFSCVKGDLAYVSVIVLVVILVAVCAYVSVYAHMLYRKIVNQNIENEDDSSAQT